MIGRTVAKKIIFWKDVFENGTKIHYNRSRGDRKQCLGISSTGVGKRENLWKRQIIRSLQSATTKVKSKLGFDSNKNPGADMGKSDPKITHLGVKPQP